MDTHALRPMDHEAGREVDLREYLHMFRRRWWLALLALVTCVGGAYGATQFQTPIYEAQTRLFVGQQSISQQNLQFAQSLTQTSLALVKSYSEAIRSRPIAQDAMTQLGLLDDPDDLLEHVSAAPVGDTQIIRITYSDPDPGKAQRVADAMAQSFISGIARIDRQGTGEAAVQVSVLEPAALPEVPASPKPKRNVAAGAVLGLTLAWGLVLLSERLDASVKGREDAEETSGLRVLALVPSMTSSGKDTLLSAEGTPAAEAFRLLRTSIRFIGSEEGEGEGGGGRDVKVLAVTSPQPNDGKTTTAYNLAVAFARSGTPTVFVEADMRKPSMAAQLRVNPKNGLSQFLAGASGSSGLVQKGPIPNLFVVSSGPVPPSPGELLANERMNKLVVALGREARVVIIDTPPVLAVSDPTALAHIIDGALLVVRAGKTGKESLREALRVLGSVGTPVLGLVLNGTSPRDSGYGYGYGYGSSRDGAKE